MKTPAGTVARWAMLWQVCISMALIGAARAETLQMLTRSAISDARASGVPEDCNFTSTVELANPMSLDPDNKFFSTGRLQQNAMMMVIDYINTERCGIALGYPGERRRLSLRTIGDNSDSSTVNSIGQMLLNSSVGLPIGWARPDVLLGPYSSGLTGHLAPLAQSFNTLLMAGGAATTSVFTDRDVVFGTFPPTDQYLAKARGGIIQLFASQPLTPLPRLALQGIEALALVGASSVAYFHESASFTSGVCAAIPGLATTYDLKLLNVTNVRSSLALTSSQLVCAQRPAISCSVTVYRPLRRSALPRRKTISNLSLRSSRSSTPTLSSAACMRPRAPTG